MVILAKVWRDGLVNLDLASGWPVRCQMKLTGEWWFYQAEKRFVASGERGIHLGLSGQFLAIYGGPGAVSLGIG